MRTVIFAALALGACATSAQQDERGVSADPVIAAELAFAQDVSVRGQLVGFRATVAPNAFSPNPDGADPVLINSFDRLAQTSESEPGASDTSLQWRPSYAGIARSGDLGFTTGPVFARDVEGARGNYFTVWRRQADGSWRWIYDGGVAAADTSSYVSSEPIRRLPIAERDVGGAQTAIAQVNAAEAELAALASGDAVQALLSHLADDAVMKRRQQPQATTREAFAALAVLPAAMLDYGAPLRTEASSAGDLVFTFGPVHWMDAEGERSGFYARIWQLRDEGWRIVYDQVNRPPRANPS